MTYVSRLFMVFLLNFFGIVNLLNEIKKSAERVTERGRSETDPIKWTTCAQSATWLSTELYPTQTPPDPPQLYDRR